MIPESHTQSLSRALALHQAGRLVEARALYRQILDSDPHNPEVLHLAGVVALQQGQHATAVEQIQLAIRIRPDNPHFHFNLGLALDGQGRIRDAIASYQEAVRLKPDFVSAWNNMGNALSSLEQWDQAVACYQRAVAMDPYHESAWNNMGIALKAMEKLDQAMDCFQKAMAINPANPDTHRNMGAIYHQTGQLKQAEICFRKVIQLGPPTVQAYSNLGVVLQESGDPESALECFQKVLALDPENLEACNNVVRQQQQTCQWRELESSATRLDALTRRELAAGRKAMEDPLVCITRHDDPAYNFQVARSWSEAVAAKALELAGGLPGFEFSDRKHRSGPIRVGYVSNDFCNHAVSHLMVAVFGAHNRDLVEVWCYSHGPDDGSTYRKRIQADCDRFVSLEGMGDLEAARRIHSDHIDILVDLKGYTRGHRLGIFALRPAPIQVTYLGFPGTTGAGFIDYIITDKVVSPPEHQPYYSEQFVYMPHCFQVNDNGQAVATGLNRRDFGLPDQGFVFCSFNQAYKLDPEMFRIWMRLLQRIPGSVLWLSLKHRLARQRLKQEAQRMGVDPDRLIFAEKVGSKAVHLGRQALADLFLDTRIYNGHTTSSDALWAGLPVITCMGNHYASRVSASLLQAVGLPELITRSLNQYEALALDLATQPHRYAAIRKRLAANRHTWPLFDTQRFVACLDTAFQRMWQRFQAGHPPGPIEVPDRQPQPWLNGQDPEPENGGPTRGLGSVIPGASGNPMDEDPEAWRRHGHELIGRQQYAEAIRWYQKGLARFPANPDMLNDLGNVFNQLNQPDSARVCYQQVLDQHPDHEAALYNLGTTWIRMQQLGSAKSCLQRLVRIHPRHHGAWNHLGVIFNMEQNYPEAVECFERALAIAPENSDAWNNLGNALNRLGKHQAALKCYDRALALKPDHARAWNNRAAVLDSCGQVDGAIQGFLKALKIQPDYVEAMNNLGNTLMRMHRMDEALAWYRRSVTTRPHHWETYGQLVHLLQYVCAWDEMAVHEKTLDELNRNYLEQGLATVESPLGNICRRDDPALNLAVARSWSHRIAQQMAVLVRRGRGGRFDFARHKSNDRILNIGYVSKDFGDHPVGHLIAGILECHDQERFSITGYALGEPRSGPCRDRIRKACHQFVELGAMDHATAARQIYEDGIHVLVDLTGHTAGGRLEVFALRPAPVQIGYLGFPGSSGASFLDYMITDKVVTPPDQASFYTEKLIYMPHCFLCGHDPQPVGQWMFQRSDFGLPENAFVFCSFHQPYKIDSVIFDAWMTILNQVPESVLWLTQASPQAMDHLRQAAHNRGVAPHRLVFARRLDDRSQYLARYQLADLSLDTRIYNGHATTWDALWAGVPVVTILGKHFASRVAASQLHAVGLARLVTPGIAEYVDLAVRLARSPRELNHIRQVLRQNRHTASLFDTPRFVRYLEIGYRTVWHRFRQGTPPESIVIG